MKKIIFFALIFFLAGAFVFISCKKETSCEGCKENNKPPIAVAGPDQVITLPTDSISLDGSTSNDPDGTISEWIWKKISGPASFNIVNTTTAKTIVRNLDTGIYQFELKVKDDKGLFAKDTVQVIVDAVVTTNHPPIANAGADKTITLPTNSVTVDGSASTDPDNNISSYSWTKISGPSSFNITNANAAQTQVINLVEGIYQFELKVTDAGGLFSKDTIQVTVSDQINRPPVANAGPDQTITLPTNAVNLDGGASSDPDNNITAYAWTKISGPSSFNIANANAVQIQVTNLVQGTYQFELKVTDAGGLFSKDTVQVSVTNQPCSQPPPLQAICDNSTRPQICAQLIPVGTLSEARAGVAVASAGNKILFAGGEGPSYPMGGSSRVDIYDIATQTWSTAELSVGRYGIAAVANGNKIFFAGGEIGDGTTTTRAVDVYDVTTNIWTVDHLSAPGTFIAAEAVANKVFFAGGTSEIGSTGGIDRTRQVDIFDLTTSSWTIAQLSESKMGHVAVTANNKIYFSGGTAWVGNGWVNSNKIDIYDNATGTWSVSVMSEDKAWHAGITVGNKIYWAGGTTGSTPNGYSCLVEIKDINTSNSAIQYLFKHGQWSGSLGANAVVKNDKIIFLRHFGSGVFDDRFDIYDITSNTWSIGVLPAELSYSSIISVNNTIYIAGGYVNGVLSNQVWKLEF